MPVDVDQSDNAVSSAFGRTVGLSGPAREQESSVRHAATMSGLSQAPAVSSAAGVGAAAMSVQLC